MAFGFRSRLGAGIALAAFLAMPLATFHISSALAEGSGERMFFGKRKQKASTAALPQAIVAGKVTTETEIVAEKNFAPMLSVDSASALQAAIDRYTQIQSNGGFPKVPKGTFKKGAQNKAVGFLNKRLFMEGYLRQEATEGEFSDRVTSATVDAVTRYQRNMGLAATGVVDGPTLAALNVPVSERIRTMQANIARLEVYSQDLGDRYLVVNVPSQQIETVVAGRVYSRHNAIVGRPERPTPVVITALSDVNFNPYWNTPPSIIERDLIPKMSSGTKILEDMNIKVFQGFGGPEIDPGTVNWRRAVADDYHFRQEPGPQNAMATAKINFPSPFGIYLHDTPEQHLFQSGNRFYSSGCVRVEKVALLLEWVLNGQDAIGSPEIAALAETLERRDVKLTTPPQLRVSYLTAWPVGNTVAFRPDVYRLDGTGFTVGQPLPMGEVAEDGQRFVLKPVPRKAGAVDADEAEGFGLFGFSKSNKRKPGTPVALFGRRDDAPFAGPPSTTVPKKLPFGIKKKTDTAKVNTLAKPNAKKVAGGKKSGPGLFDWAAYRKDEKVGGKKSVVAANKKVKKKVPAKKVEAEVAAADPKVKLTPEKKKSVAAAAKKTDDAAVKKVAAVEPKAEKSKDVAAKKPEVVAKKKAVEDTKKVADACKADAAGKLPKGCKAPAAKKP